MEYKELSVIKLFVYLSIFSSFFSGIFLVLTDFIDNQTLIEIYGNRVLFNLFIPFMIGLVCLWGTRRQNVSIYYLPLNLIFGSLLLFGYQCATVKARNNVSTITSCNRWYEQHY